MFLLKSANHLPIALIIGFLSIQTDSSLTASVRTQFEGESLSLYHNGSKRISQGFPLTETDASPPLQVTENDNHFQFRYSRSSEILATIENEDNDVWKISLSIPDADSRDGKAFIGFFFETIPGFKQGVEIWRYKPWNSWTKPIKVQAPGDLHDWDVQFFYWQYDDGTYGAAIPLSGNGYRTTLGSENGRFGCKAYTYTNAAPTQDIPMMAIAFGDDPYQLFQKLYRSGLEAMGKSQNLRINKQYPEALEYLGWCTWNASHMGKLLDEAHLLGGVSTFTDQGFPLGWLLVDDGWFDHDNSKLNATTPNPDKFPNGFKSLIQNLKGNHGLKHVGIWHAYNGYWNGINPDSDLGKKYAKNLFSWEQNERVQDADSERINYHFLKPEGDSLFQFYNEWHQYFVDQGFSFLKVDNQLVTERMCIDRYPIGQIAEKMHEALYASVFRHFDGAIINCMDMTNDAFYNFGKSAVARCVEDYFTEVDGGVGYAFERGGPAAHVLAGLYNSLYFSQMVWPDFDMFESHNTDAEFHAAARAISGGPIYITDTPGKQKFEVLWPLIDKNGRILRADQPVMLTEDCLFQVQDNKPVKAFSVTGETGLLAAFNAADSDRVIGTFSANDIDGLKGESFAIFEFYSKEITIVHRTETLPLDLKRMQCKYFNVVPLKNGVGLIGLIHKYNASKTMRKTSIDQEQITVELIENGIFKAVIPQAPNHISINHKRISNYQYDGTILTVDTGNQSSETILLEISL